MKLFTIAIFFCWSEKVFNIFWRCFIAGVVVPLLIGARTVQGINCYRCDSLHDEVCTANPTNIGPCSMDIQNFCLKIVWSYQNGSSQVQRTCSHFSSSATGKFCKKMRFPVAVAASVTAANNVSNTPSHSTTTLKMLIPSSTTTMLTTTTTTRRPVIAAASSASPDKGRKKSPSDDDTNYDYELCIHECQLDGCNSASSWRLSLLRRRQQQQQQQQHIRPLIMTTITTALPSVLVPSLLVLLLHRVAVLDTSSW